MKKLLCCLAGALALALCAAAQAGTVSGDAYVGERFGRLEIAPPAGRWAITDRESAGTSDEGGPVADLQLTAPVGDIRPLAQNSSAGRRCNWLLALVPIKSTSAGVQPALLGQCLLLRIDAGGHGCMRRAWQQAPTTER